MQTLELVTFRLAGADPEGFLSANAAVNVWVQRQPGFVSRTLSEDGDGLWTDMVVWTSRAEAEAAAAQMNADMDEPEAMGMIEVSSIVMRHSEIVLRA